MTDISECILIQGVKCPLNWYSIEVPKILESQIPTLLLQFSKYVDSVGIYEHWIEMKSDSNNQITPWWCIVHKIGRSKKLNMRFGVSIIDVNTNKVYISVQFCKELTEEAAFLLLRGMMHLEDEAKQKYGETYPLPTTKLWLPLAPWWPRSFTIYGSTAFTSSIEAKAVTTAAKKSAAESKAIIQAAVAVAKKATDVAASAKADKKTAINTATEAAEKAAAAKKDAKIAAAIAREASAAASVAFVVAKSAKVAEIATTAEADAAEKEVAEAKASAKSAKEISAKRAVATAIRIAALNTKTAAIAAAEVAAAKKEVAFISENIATAKKEAAAIAVEKGAKTAEIATIAKETSKTMSQLAIHKQSRVKLAKVICKEHQKSIVGTIETS